MDKIGIVRSETIVRTEIIRTNAEATLNRLEEMGVTISHAVGRVCYGRPTLARGGELSG